ncbi:hypothetical protein EVAR_95516_1 [Eumeta japonica]|uniref:Uncharacterized protein n=1 Tax=Eumeta variegata TaxID=151549 RepID=A0A4C1UIU1_EUMVA|nr:hypothetical protein EVAR_95516_1 [Eumeta japonica]
MRAHDITFTFQADLPFDSDTPMHNLFSQNTAGRLRARAGCHLARSRRPPPRVGRRLAPPPPRRSRRPRQGATAPPISAAPAYAGRPRY